jgi:methyl-accepting chemotaxis protein
MGLTNRSLLQQLLWPINIISVILLASLCVTLVWTSQHQIETAMSSKVNSVSSFLREVGAIYVVNYDTTALENFSKVISSDSDFAFVSFFDKDGKPMAESAKSAELSKMLESNNIVQVRQNIEDANKKTVGSLLLGYRKDRVTSAFWNTIFVMLGASVLVQFALSMAVWLVCRNIVTPISKSLEKLGNTTLVLSDTSIDISKFAESLSSGVNQQGEVVQETTAAMSEMSSMLNQTSGYAKQSDIVMESVSQRANNGMLIMNQLVEAMTSVQQANEQLRQMVEMIQEITLKTNVINDIVFKTQLLSFNASIEAARAGQHGRGFAVVAEEVGNLAKMSGKAAQEIGSLLGASEKQVNDIVRNTNERVSIGKTVTEQALKSFKEIASDIEQIAGHIDNITTATREQEMGVIQTTQAMSELSKTTELNNGIAQRASDTSRVLRSEIQALNSIARDIESRITGDLEMGHSSLSKVKASLRSVRRDVSSESDPFETSDGDVIDINSASDRVVEMARMQSNAKGSSVSKAANE